MQKHGRLHHGRCIFQRRDALSSPSYDSFTCLGFKHWTNKGLQLYRIFSKTTQQLKQLYLQGDDLLWFRLSPSAAMTCLLRCGVSSVEEPQRQNKLTPALFRLKLWTSLQSQSSTWLFPEHCLGTKRDDVTSSGTEGRKERADVGRSQGEGLPIP